MWTANAATVTPLGDGSTGATCLTIANLDASLHRAIEPDETLEELRQTLPRSFRIVAPIPGGAAMRDEGAANHMRLASQGGPAFHLFVYGDGDPLPTRYWPRQTLAASQAVARQHGLDAECTFFLKQHPKAIDAGAFHNDVVAMSDRDLLIHHEHAFHEPDAMLMSLEARFRQRTEGSLKRIVVDDSQLPIDEAVRTYLFNSEILTVDRAGLLERVILCPAQVAANPNALRLVHQWQQDGVFSEVHFVDLGQSMDGGGGPACLRLRVPVREDELDSIPPYRRWSESLDRELRAAIQNTYPVRVTIDDLARSDFLEQAIHARNQVAAVLSAH